MISWDASPPHPRWPRGRPTVRRAARRGRRFLGRFRRRAERLFDVVDPARRRCYPRDYDVIDGYKERFPDTARVFELFVKRCDPVQSGEDEASVAVAVMPWFGTPGPWFAVAIGLGLARRGRSVVFVWHDTVFPEPSAYLNLQNDEISGVMRVLGRRFRVLRLSEQPADPRAEAGDDALLDRLAAANLMWNLRGAVPTERDVRFGLLMRHNLSEALPRVRSLMRDHDFRYAVVPGGIVGPSGLYLEAGRTASVRVATFDAGLGWAEVNTDGVAAQQTDTPRAFDLLADDLRGRHGDVIEAAREEFDLRRSGLDQTRYQLARPSSSPIDTEQSILIPLSVVFDASALGRHHIFADSEEWLVETVRVLLEQTRDPILVRQHPSERRSTERSSFDVKAILHEGFGSRSQVRFIAAEDDVSTYDLLDASRLVLPFVSTIGIEAAALAKPVIVCGSVYYARLGLVWAPSSREEYFDLLAQGARGELPLLPDQVDRAWRCYYLNAVCHRVWTNFTPQPPDFWRWVARPPSELYRDPDVDDILTSIDQDIPTSILRHERRQQMAAARAVSAPMDGTPLERGRSPDPAPGPSARPGRPSS